MSLCKRRKTNTNLYMHNYLLLTKAKKSEAGEKRRHVNVETRHWCIILCFSYEMFLKALIFWKMVRVEFMQIFSSTISVTLKLLWKNFRLRKVKQHLDIFWINYTCSILLHIFCMSRWQMAKNYTDFLLRSNLY